MRFLNNPVESNPVGGAIVLPPDEQAGKVDHISWLAKLAELFKIIGGGKTFALFQGVLIINSEN